MVEILLPLKHLSCNCITNTLIYCQKYRTIFDSCAQELHQELVYSFSCIIYSCDNAKVTAPNINSIYLANTYM